MNKHRYAQLLYGKVIYIYETGYLDVTPNQTLSINVGGGSSGYWRGDGGNANVDWGANGFVLIAWGGYI